MLIDTHMHTQFSTDSGMTLAEAIARGRELDMAITITEHLDLDYPKPKAFIFDIDEYFQAYSRYRSDAVLLGIEIGMRSELVQANRAVVEGHPFDFVIGSIHVIDNIDIYLEEFYHGRSKRDVYGQYFTSMLDCLETYDFIDSLGHIDYIARYAKFADPEVRYSEFADYIDQVLVMLIDKQKALEINTRRLDQPEAVSALIPIYRRFAELGGRWVTIGSDAHTPKDIGKHFAQAQEMAASCGLRPVWFNAREPHYLDI
ncbi:MAG: histidinol phosphate phosphatase [Negativicutes bacterium]|nr:histidinol phosphate phosphatase [Negativicutes bacterium]